MTSYAMLTGDVAAVLANVPDNTFDAVLCDPPYGLSFMGKAWDYDVPTAETWAQVLRVCKPGAALLAFFGTRTYHRGVVRLEDGGFEIRDCLAWMYGQGFPKSLDVSKAVDDGGGRAKDWAGYGTALKPAFEPCVLARKPLEGTVAANVTKWGCGALAIDACRIEGGERTKIDARGKVNESEWGTMQGSKADGTTTQGRWPANVLLDDEAAAALDAQTGDLKGGTAIKKNLTGRVEFSNALGNKVAKPGPDIGYADAGGASRFFYTAKVSKAEREAGCEALALHSAGATTDRADGSKGLESPRAGAGRTGGARNHHPTLKPIALTRYLASLIKPPGTGSILVPFAGAGSEVIGAMQAGWAQVIGIERDPEYVAIAQARIAHWTEKGRDK